MTGSNKYLFSLETDEDQLPESTEDENDAIVVQSSNDEDEFAVEYEPISFSDEERLIAIRGFDQGILIT